MGQGARQKRQDGEQWFKAGKLPVPAEAPHGTLPDRCRPPFASSTPGETRARNGPSVGPCHVARRHRKIDPTLHGAGDMHAVLRRMEGELPDLSGIVVILDEIAEGFGELHPGPGMTVARIRWSRAITVLIAGGATRDRKPNGAPTRRGISRCRIDCWRPCVAATPSETAMHPGRRASTLGPSHSPGSGVGYNGNNAARHQPPGLHPQ